MNKTYLIIKSLLFNIIAVCTLFPYSLLVCAFTFFLPVRYRYFTLSRWTFFIVWLAKTLCGVKYQITGLENIPEQPAVVLCKHQSSWETYAVQVIFPYQAWALKRELLQIPGVGWALALTKPISINRDKPKEAIRKLINEGKQHLASGRWVIIFPEGTRIAPGEKGRYQKGGAMLAHAAGAPIVPMAHNAGTYWPRRGFLKTPGTVQVVIGPPIYPENHTPAELINMTETWIENTMQTLQNSVLQSDNKE